jgi:hypothetical protein
MPTLSSGGVARAARRHAPVDRPHCGGYAFARFHQPPVIGEILDGLALGPSLPGVIAPGVEAHLSL